MISVSKDSISSVERTITDFRSELDKVMGTHNSGCVQDIKIQFDRIDFGMWSDDVKDKLSDSLTNTSRQLDVMADSFSSGNLKNISDNTDLILQEIDNFKKLKDRYDEVCRKIRNIDGEDETKKTYLSNLKSTKSSLNGKMDNSIDTIKQYLQRYSTYDFEGSGATSGDAGKIGGETVVDDIPEEVVDQPKPKPKTQRDPALDNESVGKYEKVLDTRGVAAYKVTQANDALGLGWFGNHTEGYVFVVPTTEGGYQYNYVPASLLGDDEATQVKNLEAYILTGQYMIQDVIVYKAVGDRNSGGQSVPVCVHSSEVQTNGISEGGFNSFVSQAQSTINGAQWYRDCYFDAYGRSTIGCQYQQGLGCSATLGSNVRGTRSGISGQY